LGSFKFATYQSAAFTLDPGDVLVIYSDGLTEAENPREEMFGEERLQALIAKSAPLGGPALEDNLLAEITGFTEGTPQTDDITFVLIQRLP
jgi:sigma-B regulation protein RsbU (phosphoserine phosphatase)